MKNATGFCALLALLLGACSLAEAPEASEPVLTMMPADGIGRREATLHASTDERGAAAFAAMRFLYTEAAKDSWTVSEDVPLVDRRAELTLTGLEPGTTYRCRAEAHTATATLYSADITFTTAPVDAPALGEASILTKGPTGFVLGFSVTEDGGEPLTAAGVEVTDLSTGETRHEAVREPLDGPGDYTVTVTGLGTGRRYSVVPYAANASACAWGGAVEFAASEAYVVTEPGQLEEMLAVGELPQRKLIVAGPLDGDDFRALRGLFSGEDAAVTLTALDLSGVDIRSGGGFYDGQRKTEEDVVTTGLFASLPRLAELTLPLTVTAIRRDAFTGTPLRVVTVPPGAVDVMPSEGCPLLERVEVAGGNRHFHSVDGVLYDMGVSRIVWFPQGKTGEYTMPPSIAEIGANAFRGTSITSIEIPDGVGTIARGAFSGSALERIGMPPGLTVVAEGLFQDCTALREVRLGPAVEYMGAYVFDGTPLEVLVVEAEFPPVVTGDTFSEEIFSGCELRVPSGSKGIYRNHRWWGLFDWITGF